jgi:glycogen phosphorylase
MRALRSFTVRPHLPDPLAPMLDLAMNLRWSWDDRTRDVFRWVDPDAWEVTGHDPVRLLGLVPKERFEQLAGDAAFLGLLDDVHGELRRYLEMPRWFQGRSRSPLRRVAYFSPEFGIAEALPQYSGGLGVLAGDHLKAASALGVPLVGVGLLYREGYFRQELDADGWQRERYVQLDPYAMALEPVEGVRVSVDLAGATCHAQVWRGQVGRIPLYLLDSDVDDNADDERGVTDRLYGGGTEHRLRQEILLGIGGVRALEAVGEQGQVFHTNEGHAGFLGLERIRRVIADEGLSFPEAIEAIRAGTVFTTHTPVPAGIDQFPRELIAKYFGTWASECKVTLDELMALGHAPDQPVDAPFNMAVMGLRLASRSNGVSKLHGRVSRQMFASLWQGVPVEEVPIASVTNGVHARTWVSQEMSDLLDRYVLPEWHEAEADRWARIDDAREEEIWRVREQGRHGLVGFVRRRLREAGIAQGLSESDAAWADDVLDGRILTIGFARRFAAYKRATLLLSQPERLKRLLLDPQRPIQVVFAGKAHPADDVGKEMIRQIVQFSRQADVRHRIAFVPDYDIAVARVLFQGSDVWLNNPRRPMEACGTSGEKAALNGALNCSVLDGWWDEMFNGENGWAISSAEAYEDLARRDEVEAASLYELLERQIIPLFYDRRDEAGVPRQWVRRVRASLKSLGPRVTASRMLRDYVEELYEPTAEHADALSAGGDARARALAAWKARVAAAWPTVAVRHIEAPDGIAELGATRTVTAVVAMGGLNQDDIAVQLLHGPVGPNDELTEPSTAEMAFVDLAADRGSYRYEGTFECTRAGRYGFTVRVVPSHPDLVTYAELGCAALPA